MKKFVLRIMVMSVAVFTLAMVQSCRSDRKSEENRSESGELLQEDPQNGDVRRMQLTSREYTAKVGSNDYSIHITRLPDDNLPTVMSDMEVKYTDNRVELNIKQGDRVVVSRNFTKSDFASLFDNSFLRKAVLSGMIFNKVEGGKMLFAASACYPQTDMCVTVILTVTTDGQISMEKSEMLEDDYESAE